MVRKQIDLIIVLVLAAAGVTAACTDLHAMAIRGPLAVLLIAVLPGYTILRAVRLQDAGFPARVLLILGISVALTGLGGFVLNETPWGLQARSWAVLLGGVTAIAAIIALVRRDNRAPIRPRARPAPHAHLWKARHTILLVMALCVVTSAATVAYLGASHQPRNGFTQLWMTPEPSAGPTALRLGIDSEELTATQYRLDLSIEGQVVQEWSVPTLKPHDQWQTIVIVPNGSGTVEATLYRADAPNQVYRHTALVP
ncbi:MAG: DUF1616 domain-containing protein [Chloroflexota bacterium]|nr:DUF1616 domain-containing protein [Chloroflexota bacterium]